MINEILEIETKRLRLRNGKKAILKSIPIII